MLRLSGWGVVLHTGAGILLGCAIVVGAAVEGGVVAYQVAWVFFLGPYAVLAQPLHTAILPELVGEVGEPGREQYRRSVQWSLERMALLVLPVSAAMAALALPAMRFVAFGESADGGAPLLAAALASLAVGLFPYSAFLLLSRAFYALGDSRTPGVVALVTAIGGAVVMVIGGVMTDGTALLTVLGGAHSAAYTVGAVVLAVRLAPRMLGRVRLDMLVRMTVVAVLGGAAAWSASQPFLDGDGRIDDLLAMGTGLLAGAAVTAVAFVVLGVRRAMITRTAPPPVAAEEDVALDLVNDPEVLA